MDISVYEQSGRLFYEIRSFDPNLEKTFEKSGYNKSGDSYIKSFPLTFPYSDKIVRNFLKNAEAMFCEEASGKPMKWREGFKHFASVAKKAHIDWWTTGKILLPLNGIDAEIDDVDFYFHEADLDAIYAAFSDDIVEPIVSDSHRSNAFKYSGMAYSRCPVCLFVEPLPGLDLPEPVHFGPYAAGHLIAVNWNGCSVKVPPIELYINTLKHWGRHEAAEWILRALSDKRQA